MKKLMKSLMLFAAAAMALTSCENEAMNEGIQENDTYTMTFVAGAPESRTSVSVDEANKTASFQWSAGDKVGFYYVATDVDYKKKGNSAAAEIAEDGTATFTGSFTANDGATAYNIAAFYPGNSWTTHAGENYFNNVNVKIGANQALTNGSFDATADLMMSKPFMGVALDKDAVKTLEFTRIAAIGKMNLKLDGMAEGEVIQSVKFSLAEGTHFNGPVVLDMEKGTYTLGTEGTSNAVTLTGSLAANADRTAIYFTCFPGDYTGAYTIEVATDKATYSKEGSLTKALSFTAGNVLGFNATVGNRQVEEEEVIDPNANGEVTIDFSSTAQRESLDTNKQVWKNGAVTFTNDKAQSTTAVADYSNPVRCYKNSSLTFTAPNNITKIVFNSAENGTTDSKKYFDFLQADLEALGTITVSGTEVTFVPTATASKFTFTAASGQIRLFSATVCYGAADTREKLATPVVTAEADGTTINVSWTAVDGAANYLVSINPDEEDFGVATVGTTSYTYTEQNYSTTYTISVVAVPADDTTHRESAAGTATVKTDADPDAEEPAGPEAITVAEFLDKEVDENVEYILTGTITGTYNTNYGNFYLQDTTGKVLIYGLYDSTGEKCYTALGLADGDIITIKGTRGDHDGTAQMKNAVYINHTVTASVSVNPESLVFSSEGGNKIVTITTRGEGSLNIVKSEGADWLTLSTSGTTLNVDASKNETDGTREATITVEFAGITKTISVSQEKKSEDTGDTTKPVTTKVTFANSGYANETDVNGKIINLDSNISVVFAKGGASSTPKYYNSGAAIRMYQNGATLTITAANGKTITGVKLTYASNMYYLNANTGNLSNTSTLGTWTGSASEILFTCYGTSKSQRAYISAIEVTYE